MTGELPLKNMAEQALAAKAWPFEEARKLLARVEARKKAGHAVTGVLFETGYGPSGLPHIGTNNKNTHCPVPSICGLLRRSRLLR